MFESLLECPLSTSATSQQTTGLSSGVSTANALLHPSFNLNFTSCGSSGRNTYGLLAQIAVLVRLHSSLCSLAKQIF